VEERVPFPIRVEPHRGEGKVAPGAGGPWPRTSWGLELGKTERRDQEMKQGSNVGVKLTLKGRTDLAKKAGTVRRTSHRG